MPLDLRDAKTGRERVEIGSRSGSFTSSKEVFDGAVEEASVVVVFMAGTVVEWVSDGRVVVSAENDGFDIFANRKRFRRGQNDS